MYEGLKAKLKKKVANSQGNAHSYFLLVGIRRLGVFFKITEADQSTKGQNTVIKSDAVVETEQ